jgi:hypothetical protein
MEEIFQIGFAILVLVVAVYLFISISMKLRKGGGSLTTTRLGSTDLFYDREKKNAVCQMIERKAGIKQEEQGSEKGKMYPTTLFYLTLLSSLNHFIFINNHL